jgi:hypothetical protein
MNPKPRNVVLFLFLVSCYFYNFQNTYLRLAVIFCWTLASIYIFLGSSKRVSVDIMVISLVYTSYFLMSLILRPADLGLSISGPKVEALTVFLFPVYFFIFGGYKNVDSFVVRSKVIWTLIVLLLIDVCLRFYLDSHCFMNYQCRQAAKTVGLFSTTNVTGACITLLILTVIQLKVQFKKAAITLLTLILVTTMARAAIAGLLVGVLYYVATNYRRSRFFVGFLISIIVTIMSYLIYIFNIFQDGSLLSKFDFISSTYLVLKGANVQQILFGFGSSYESIIGILGVNDWSPHIPAIKAFLYFGGLGVAMYFFPLLWMIKMDRKMITVLVGYGVFSMGGAPIVFPALIGSMLLLRKKRNRVCDNSNIEWRKANGP